MSNKVEVIVTNYGKSFLNKQMYGQSLSMIGFVPFNMSNNVIDSNFNRTNLISDAMTSLYNTYYFNGIKYVFDGSTIDAKNKDEQYSSLFDLISKDNLYKVKYTNTKNGSEYLSLYNIHFDLDDIDIEYKENNVFKTKVNGFAIFIQSNIVSKSSNGNDIEILCIVKFDESIDLVNGDLNWIFAFNENGEMIYENLFNETQNDFTNFGVTEKSNVQSASNFSPSTSYTFSDNFYDNAKTWYYDLGWEIGFAKGGLNNHLYDLTLINDSASENAYTFNINPHTNSLEMFGVNRDSNIVFGDLSENFESKNSFILGSPEVSSTNSNNIVNVNTNSNYEDSNYIVDINVSNAGGNEIKNSEFVTVFGYSNKISGDNNFVNGDNNEIKNSSGVYIVGDNNVVGNNDIYIFGNNLSAEIPNSYNFGKDYHNKNFTFVYSNGTANYGLYNQYGNFIIFSNENDGNVQFTKDSVYLMNSFDFANPNNVKNSLLINSKNVSAENSIVQGDYTRFDNSKVVDSVVIASAYNLDKTKLGYKENVIVENSLDFSLSSKNINANNSILGGKYIESTNGATILNSYVGNLKTDSGIVNNSCVLDSNNKGELNVNQSLIVSNPSEIITKEASITNSIIQGNTQKSKFINSHLIGNLPNGVEKTFENCLVIADGTEFVEIYADKIVKNIDGQDYDIYFKNGLVKQYMDEDCARGKERNGEYGLTYQEKLNSYIGENSGLYRVVQTNDVLFAGEAISGKSTGMCNLYIHNDKYDFELICTFDTNDKSVICNINDFAYYPKLMAITGVPILETTITKFFEFGFNGKKLYIKNKFTSECVVVYRFSTCNILDDKDFNAQSIVTPQLYISDVDAYKVETNKHYDTINYDLSDLRDVNCDTLLLQGNDNIIYSATVGNYYCSDKYTNNLLKRVENFTPISDLDALSLYGQYISSGFTFSLKTQNSNEVITFDGLTNSGFYIDSNDILTWVENKNPLTNAYNTKLLHYTKGIPIKEGNTYNDGTKFNDFHISTLLNDEYDDDEIMVFNNTDNHYHTKDLDKKGDRNNYYCFSHIDYSNDDINNNLSQKNDDAMVPDLTFKEYLDLSNITHMFNYTKLMLWGRMANMTILTSNFNIKSGMESKFFGDAKFGQLPILKVHSNLYPISPVYSYFWFANYGELYPFSSASYRLSEGSGKLYLNLHEKSRKYNLPYHSPYEKLPGGHGVYKCVYINPFLLDYNSDVGLLKHEMTYMLKCKSQSSVAGFSGIETNVSCTNTLFNNLKNKIAGKSYVIVRMGEYFYT